MIKHSHWLTVPPKWKTCFICAMVALICYITWVILDMRGIELYYRTDPRGGMVLALLGVIYSSVSYVLHDKYLSVRVLGICVRRIYYVEFREGVFLPHSRLGKKTAHPGAAILLMRTPSPAFNPQKDSADRYVLCHPFDSILIDIPKDNESAYISAFEKCMPEFRIVKTEENSSNKKDD